MSFPKLNLLVRNSAYRENKLTSIANLSIHSPALSENAAEFADQHFEDDVSTAAFSDTNTHTSSPSTLSAHTLLISHEAITSDDPMANSSTSQEQFPIPQSRDSTESNGETSAHNSNDASAVDDTDETRQSIAHFLGNEIRRSFCCSTNSHRNMWEKPAQQGSSYIDLASIATFFATRLGDPLNTERGKWISEDQFSRITPFQWRSILSGYVAEPGNYAQPTKPPTLSLLRSDTRSCPKGTLRSFDIDSILGIPSSLAFARIGIDITFAPQFVRNIQSNLHVQLNVPMQSTSEGRNDFITNRSLHLIPHFYLGRVCSIFPIDIYCFLPSLYQYNTGTNFLNERQLSQIIDHIILPAVYDSCPADLLQHYPSSYADACARSSAAGTEMRTNATRTSGRLQSIHYTIPGKYLEAITLRMHQYARSRLQSQYQDLVLFINAKNLKTLTKQSKPLDCFRNFLNMWNISCNAQFLPATATWIDYATELAPASSALTENQDARVFLWRSCCLDQYIERMKRYARIEKGSVAIAKYQWGLCTEASNITIESTGKSPYRIAGLAYTQLYSSTKEIFDANKTYPFTNPSIEALAVDPRLSAGIHHAGGGHSDEITIQDAYFHSRDRSFQTLAQSQNRSFGIRHEHRITIRLLQELFHDLKQHGQNQPMFGTHLPVLDERHFFNCRSVNVCDFLAHNLTRFVLPFEAIVRRTSTRDVSWRHTKVMIMALRCLKYAYNSGDIMREAGLWHDTVEQKYEIFKRDHRGTGKVIHGMGLSTSFSLYNYGWLLDDRINYNTLTFRPSMESSIFFNNNSLMKKYKKRWPQVEGFAESFHQMELIKDACNESMDWRGSLTIRHNIRIYLRAICIQAFWKECWLHLKQYILPNVDDADQCIDGLIPLSFDTIYARVDMSQYPIRFMLPTNRRRFTSHQIAEYIWEFDDGKQREFWNNKTFRQLYQTAVQIVHDVGMNDKDFRKRFLITFLQTTSLFPQPINRSFFPRDKPREDPLQPFHWHHAEWTLPGIGKQPADFVPSDPLSDNPASTTDFLSHIPLFSELLDQIEYGDSDDPDSE